MLQYFPVLGGARYSSDFNAVRTESFRQHLGNDLFAPEGTPVVAVDNGSIRFGTDPLGGNVANLRSTDGTRYYYAHLLSFEGVNRNVRAGEVIGYLGRTGNAASTQPHVHFEVHPGGGVAVDPYPLLQRSTILQPTQPRRPQVPIFPIVLLAAGITALTLSNIPRRRRAFV